jgi:hypothetical protein
MPRRATLRSTVAGVARSDLGAGRSPSLRHGDSSHPRHRLPGHRLPKPSRLGPAFSPLRFLGSADLGSPQRALAHRDRFNLWTIWGLQLLLTKCS